MAVLSSPPVVGWRQPLEVKAYNTGYTPPVSAAGQNPGGVADPPWWPGPAWVTREDLLAENRALARQLAAVRSVGSSTDGRIRPTRSPGGSRPRGLTSLITSPENPTCNTSAYAYVESVGPDGDTQEGRP